MSDEIEAAAEPEKPESFGDEPAEPTVAEKAEEVLDEAIEKALGPDEDDEPAPAKKGTKAVEDDEDELEELPEDDDELEDSAEKDEDDEEEESDADEDDDMALHRAYTRLHEHGIPAKVLKRTPKDELISWANRVAEVKAEAADTPSKAEQGRETTTATPKADGKQTAPAWADHRRVLAEKLGLDEETVDAFKPLYDSNAALQARLDAMEHRDQQREGQTTIDREMRRLVGTYGKALKGEGEKKEAILEEASTIVAGLKARGEKINVRAAFDKAARVVLGDPKRSDLAAKRRNGVSSPPERIGTGRTAPLDEDDYWSRGIDLALAGKGKDAIAALKPPSKMKPTNRLI